MTQDFIDDLIEVVEVKKTVKKSSIDYKATKSKTFEIAGVEIQNKRFLSEEARRKISKGNKGKILSEETKKKMSEARKKRLIISEETRLKLREAHKFRSHNRPIMTPNGEFISKESLKQRLVADGVIAPTVKIREWFRIYPNDYFYIQKKVKSD
jgi:hypothetical protein